MNKMNKKKREIVNMLLHQKLDNRDEEELIDMLIDSPIAVDIDKQERQNMTFGEKVADKFSAIAGSWTFILFFTFFLIAWVIVNAIVLKEKPIDPYPFILLNLVLSCIAAIQAPIIMMSQNREAKKDSLRNQNDYKTDLKSELILEDLHHKMETLINNQNRIINMYEKKIQEKEKNTPKMTNYH